MRRFALGSTAALAFVALAIPARADAPVGVPAPSPAATASDADAEAALEKFKEDWKATGLKGEERLSQRDYAMKTVSRVQHKKVAETLGGVAAGSDEVLRMVAVAYLGRFQALPGAAGTRVAAAMRKAPKDDVLAMTGLQSVGKLKYLGARDDLKAGLKNNSFAVKKTALSAAALTADARLLEDVLAVIGVRIDSSGKNTDPPKGAPEVVGEGSSWEGAEASVDTGTAGDGDQKAAEAKVAEQLARNRAAAGAGGGEGGGRGASGAARSVKELVPFVLGYLKNVTGKTFSGSKEFLEWFKANRATIDDAKKRLDDEQKAQEAAAK